MLTRQFQPAHLRHGCLRRLPHRHRSRRTDPANLINPNAAAYIKDIYSKLALNSNNTVAATTAGFFAQRNLYNSDMYIARIDHSFNDRFNIWGKFEIDQIPTTEPGGLLTGSTIPGGAITNTNSPGRALVVHAINTVRPSLLNESGFNWPEANDHQSGRPDRQGRRPDINPAEPFTNTRGGAHRQPDQRHQHHRLRPLPRTEPQLHVLRQRHLDQGPPHRQVRLEHQPLQQGQESASAQQGTFGFTNAGAPTGTSAFQQSFANFLLGNVATFTMPSTDITPMWPGSTKPTRRTISRSSAPDGVTGVRWSLRPAHRHHQPAG